MRARLRSELFSSRIRSTRPKTVAGLVCQVPVRQKYNPGGPVCGTICESEGSSTQSNQWTTGSDPSSNCWHKEQNNIFDWKQQMMMCRLVQEMIVIRSGSQSVFWMGFRSELKLQVVFHIYTAGLKEQHKGLHTKWHTDVTTLNHKIKNPWICKTLTN